MAHVTFIHGVGNKPDSETLLSSWLRSLRNSNIGLDIEAEGVTTSMVYWADVLYPDKLPASEYESSSDEELESVKEYEDEAFSSLSRLGEGDVRWILELEQRLEKKLIDEKEAQDGPTSANAEGLERIPVPWLLKRPFLKMFLRDVHHYLFNAKHSPRPGVEYYIQDEIRKRFVEAVAGVDTDQHVIVSHSLGTVIAYDCLKRVPETGSINTLITVGSPLGLDEVQDKLQPGWTRDDGFPHEKLKGNWINVFDRLDVVAALDPKLSNDFRHNSEKVIDDKSQSNEGRWRHDMKKYLAGSQLSEAIYHSVGIEV